MPAREEGVSSPGCPEQGWEWGGFPFHGGDMAWSLSPGWGAAQSSLASREMREFLWLHISWSLRWPFATQQVSGEAGNSCGTRARKVLSPSEPRPGDTSTAQGVRGPEEPASGSLLPRRCRIATSVRAVGNWNRLENKERPKKPPLVLLSTPQMAPRRSFTWVGALSLPTLPSPLSPRDTFACC